VILNELGGIDDTLMFQASDVSVIPVHGSNPTALHTSPTLVYGTPDAMGQDVEKFVPDGVITQNWDQDMKPSETGQSIDLNNLAFPGCGSSPSQKLVDVEDWPHLNYDLRNVVEGSFNSIINLNELNTKSAGGKGDTYDGLVKWHVLNGPELLDNTIQKPGDIVNIGFQIFSCSPVNLIDELPFFDYCIDENGIVMQVGWYNEQLVEEFATPEEIAVCLLDPPDDNLNCEQELLELVELDGIDDEFFVRVSQISGGESDVLGDGIFREFGRGEFILLEDDVGGFFNLFWDTDNTDLGTNCATETSAFCKRDLVGPATYAVDIILDNGNVESSPLVDGNLGSTYEANIPPSTITDDPFQTGLQTYEAKALTSFILTVEGP